MSSAVAISSQAARVALRPFQVTPREQHGDDDAVHARLDREQLTPVEETPEHNPAGRGR